MLRLMIDPGHGGADRGAVANTAGGGKFVEAEYNLHLARLLAARVGSSGEPFEVGLTRERDDETASQSVRGSRSAAFGADLVLSLHVNAGPPLLRGGMAFYWPGSALGQEVADAILRAYPPPLLRDGRLAIATTNTPDWLRRARSVVGAHRPPTVLVEVGFLSHDQDLAALEDPATQSGIVAALMCGLARFRQVAAG